MRADCGVRGVWDAGLDLGYEVAPGEVVVILGRGGRGGSALAGGGNTAGERERVGVEEGV